MNRFWTTCFHLALVSLDIDWDARKAMTQMADKIHYLSEITKGTAAETLFSSAFLPRYLSTATA